MGIEMVDGASVDIHYLKTPGFREIACDGAVGGATPNGKIWLSFYTERFPLPRITRHPVIEDPSGGHSLEMPGEVVDGRSGIIRNIEFGVFMSKDEARNLADWLVEALRETEPDGEESR